MGFKILAIANKYYQAKVALNLVTCLQQDVDLKKSVQNDCIKPSVVVYSPAEMFILVLGRTHDHTPLWITFTLGRCASPTMSPLARSSNYVEIRPGDQVQHPAHCGGRSLPYKNIQLAYNSTQEQRLIGEQAPLRRPAPDTPG